MADNSEKLTQFVAVTGVDEERARFYLESSAWQLEIALASFYENDMDDSSAVESIDTSNLTSSFAPSDESKPAKKHGTTNPNFGTIHTVNSSSDEEEEGQAYYAGGSEQSGQQVLGPPKKKDIVSDMFKAVKEHGVEIIDQSPSTSAAFFRGTGYKLGQTGSDSETIAGPPEPSHPEQVTLKLWREGFSMDNGELRMYSDPSNREFLESIRRGEIPSELRKGTSEVHLAMEDHRMENFRTDGERRYVKPFTGQGHSLGSPAPATIGSPAIEQKDFAANETRAKQTLSTDTSQPTTNIQIRLADGSRIVGQFNHNHTVGQVRSYITAARPQYEMQDFALVSLYPSRELKDSEILGESGLLNSAIMQKMT